MRFRDIIAVAARQNGGGAPAPPGTPIAFVNNTAASYTGASTGCTTSALDTSSADFIVVCVTGYGLGDPFAVSDSKSNTWTACTLRDATSSNPSSQVFYCANPTKGSGHTFTLSGNTVYGRINVLTFSGVKQTSSLDAQTSGTGVVDGTVPVTSGPLTPAANGALLIAVMGSGGSGPVGTAFNGSPAFTTVDLHDATSGHDYNTGVAYYVQPTAGSIDSGWLWTGGSGAVIASLTAFKAA